MAHLMDHEVEDRRIPQDHASIPKDLVRDATAVARSALALGIIISTSPVAPGSLGPASTGFFGPAGVIVGCKEALQLCDVGL